jgi:hypothetical protein
MSVLTPHEEFNLVEEEPDDSPFHEDALSAEQDYESLGDAGYTQARALEQLHGLSPDTVSIYQQAGRNLITAAAEERLRHENGELERLDPILRIKIADCLAKQALATDVAPYKGLDYQENERWEKIQRTYIDGTVEAYNHHQYLQELTGEYLLQANAILEEESVQSELAEEFTVENPADVMPEAAAEAAQDIEADTQEYMFHFSANEPKGLSQPQSTPAGKAGIKRFIKANAEQPYVGAALFSRMSEIALEELTDEFTWD